MSVIAVYFPTINAAAVTTQLPFRYSNAFETVVGSVETGSTYTWPRRGSGLTGYPTGPLFSCVLNYPLITDAEVLLLRNFHTAMRGRWQVFRFLDPAGNLLRESENITAPFWSASGSPTTDPFGGMKAYATSSALSGIVASNVNSADDGGMHGASAVPVGVPAVLCFSAWVKGPGPVTLGLTHCLPASATFATTSAWKRYDFNATVQTDDQIHATLSGQSAVYGLQVVAMKGPGGLIKTPGNYGYHKVCRFDTDAFSVRSDGPNQNALQLPICEVNE